MAYNGAMNGLPPGRSSLATGLSARLLALTVAFVMLAEVFTYVPSIARFRQVYLHEQIAKGYLAVMAVRASPSQEVNQSLADELLSEAGAHAIVLKTPEWRMLMLSDDMPPPVDVAFDLRTQSMVDWIVDAFAAMAQGDNRVMRVIAATPRDGDGAIEVVLDETPLRREMYAYSWRILTLSIIISLITAGLVFISLQWLMVRPILRLTDSLVRFRADPEDETVTLPATGRSDEIGRAQRALTAMQDDLRAALRQKAHLAALGAAVARINHDLRNTLATAVIASDRLAALDDPEVRRVTPRLYAAIDRAVTLCSDTLAYVRDPHRHLRPRAFVIGELIAEVAASVVDGGAPARIEGAGLGTEIEADRDQLYRALANLALNAVQAGSSRLSFDVVRRDGRVVIDVADDGPGIADAVRATLFEPFAGSARSGSSGLGLAIARDIARAHDGDLELAATGAEGSRFRMELPVRRTAAVR
jgi:signal transduction histidine kinase